MPPQYKFVEVAPVTDESLEECVNDWVTRGEGWALEGIRFVTTEHSKRPALAFVSFTRDAKDVDREAPRKPRPLVAVGLDPGDEGEPAVLTAPAGTDVD